MHHLQKQDLYDPVLDGLVSPSSTTRPTSIRSSVRSVPDGKLTTGKIAELISPDYLNMDDNRPIFEWLEVIRKRDRLRRTGCTDRYHGGECRRQLDVRGSGLGRRTYFTSMVSQKQPDGNE